MRPGQPDSRNRRAGRRITAQRGSGQAETRGYTGGDSGNDGHGGAGNDQAHDRAAGRTQRDTDADLARAADGGIVDDAIQSDTRQQQRDYREESRQKREQAFGDQGVVNLEASRILPRTVSAGAAVSIPCEARDQRSRNYGRCAGPGDTPIICNCAVCLLISLGYPLSMGGQTD